MRVLANGSIRVPEDATDLAMPGGQDRRPCGIVSGMNTATWVQHPHYDGYLISSNGQVLGKRGWALKPQLNRNGYLYVDVPDPQAPGQYKKRYVHSLVCEAFHGPRPEGLTASHLNGVRTDNRAENLLWETQQANTVRQKEHGTQARRGGGKSRFTEAEADAIRLRITEGETSVSVAADLGVSTQTIYRLKHRKSRKNARTGG